jgi:hypothetical protein
LFYNTGVRLLLLYMGSSSVFFFFFFFFLRSRKSNYLNYKYLHYFLQFIPNVGMLTCHSCIPVNWFFDRWWSIESEQIDSVFFCQCRLNQECSSFLFISLADTLICCGNKSTKFTIHMCLRKHGNLFLEISYVKYELWRSLVWKHIRLSLLYSK